MAFLARLACTFAECTPESAEAGDYSDSGFEPSGDITIDQYDIDDAVMVLDLDDNEENKTKLLAHALAKALRREGATYSEGSNDGRWYGTGFHCIDLRTGTDKEQSWHTDELSDDVRAELARLMQSK